MRFVEVTELNIADAGRIHSESWKESHRSFCSAEFVEKHTPAAQADYLRREMNTGKSIYMLIDNYPVGIVSVYGSLIENLYVLPYEQRKGYGSLLLDYAIRHCTGTPSLWIFNASIRDNITMFSDFPRKEVDRAIELSGLSKLIAERGEDYLCGENGSGLSGGEKQRISIARSLLKKSQVLLVDEATAALDAQTAFQVSNAILDLNGLTRIVVTHSLDENLLKRYDCVLTLKNGSITESGSFDELMANNLPL